MKRKRSQDHGSKLQCLSVSILAFGAVLAVDEDFLRLSEKAVLSGDVDLIALRGHAVGQALKRREWRSADVQFQDLMHNISHLAAIRACDG